MKDFIIPLLISHTILAATIIPIDHHQPLRVHSKCVLKTIAKSARWTWPLWMYV